MHNHSNPLSKIAGYAYIVCTVYKWVPSWENRLFAYAKTKTQISFAVTAKLISAFIFATRIVQSLYFLNTKLQASSHFLWQYSPVSVGPGSETPKTGFLTTRLKWSLITVSGSPFFGSVVRALALWPTGPRFKFHQGRAIFSYASFLCYCFHVVRLNNIS